MNVDPLQSGWIGEVHACCDPMLSANTLFTPDGLERYMLVVILC